MIKPFFISTIALLVIGYFYAIRYDRRLTKQQKADAITNSFFVKATIAFFAAIIFLFITAILFILSLFN